MTTVEVMRGIAERLSHPPFSLQLSIFDLDAKSDADFVQLIRIAIGKLDDRYISCTTVQSRPTTASGIRPVTAVTTSIVDQSISYFQTNDAVIDFLRINGCPITDGALHDRPSLLSCLAWILQTFPTLTQNARVNRFCVSLEIPDALQLGDAEMASLQEEFDAIKSELKSCNTELVDLVRQKNDMAEVQTRVYRLRTENEQLTNKLDRAKRRSSGREGFSATYKAVSATRTARDQLTKLRHTHTDLSGHVTKLESEMGCLIDDMGWMEASAPTPAAVATRRRRINEINIDSAAIGGEISRLRDLCAQPVSTTDIQRLKDELAVLSAEVVALRDKWEKAEEAAAADDSMAGHYLEYSQAKARNDTMSVDVVRLREERNQLDRIVKVAEAEFEKKFKCRYVPDMVAYVSNLRTRGLEYKENKATVMALREELRLLNVDGVDPIQSEMAGATGDGSRQVNALKESTLEEISKIVTELNVNLVAKKTAMTPKLKELRVLRDQLDLVRGEYLARKGEVAVRLDSVDRELAGLQSALQAKEKELAEIESIVQSSEAAITQSDEWYKRAELEAMHRAGQGRFSSEFSTYAEFAQSTIEEKLESLASLQEELDGMDKVDVAIKREHFGVVFALLKRMREEAGSRTGSAVSSHGRRIIPY